MTWVSRWIRSFALAVAGTAAADVCLAAPAIPLPKPQRAQPVEALPEVIGETGTGLLVADDTLLDVAKRNNVGFEPLVRLNPGIDVWMPKPGTKVVLPTRMIPPRAPRKGLVLNLPEMRLYDYTQGPDARVYPIAIGAVETPSPTGNLRVEWKAFEPVWRVPASIRAVDPDLPSEVAPGPDNPLGRHWLGIGDGYGIHGTNNRWSIGRLTTHGCIRLDNDDIAELYERIPVGMPVLSLYQTVKLGRSGDDLFVEVHPDLYARDTDPLQAVLSELLALDVLEYVERDALEAALRDPRGIPQWIGTLPHAEPAPRPASAR
jgi:L,D-transpeptidase ErfK/SrfK